MKLLLSSAGIRNPQIRAALDGMLPKPVAECDALAITTASYGHPWAGPPRAFEFVAATGQECPMVELGWKSVGLVELTALPSLPRERWVGWFEAADVLLVNGGDAAYLAHHMRECGLDELLPTLDAVWVGLSGGSMALTPRIGPSFVTWPESGADDTTLGLVDFAIFPHLDVFPTNTMAEAEKWAAAIGVPSYAMDDDTAVVWVDGEVEVVSGTGNWKHFAR